MKGNSTEDAAESSPPLEWKFSQVFGERGAGEEVQEGMICLSPFPESFLSVAGTFRVSCGVCVFRNCCSYFFSPLADGIVFVTLEVRCLATTIRKVIFIDASLCRGKDWSLSSFFFWN